MKKSILFLVAFMLLGLSFAKAQLVIMYDLSLHKSSRGETLIFVNTNLGIGVTINVPSKDQKMNDFRVFLNGNGVETRLTNINTSVIGVKSNVFEGKIGNRKHLVCIDVKNKKCVYSFFDDPLDEFLQKAIQKGF